MPETAPMVPRIGYEYGKMQEQNKNKNKKPKKDTPLHTHARTHTRAHARTRKRARTLNKSHKKQSTELFVSTWLSQSLFAEQLPLERAAADLFLSQVVTVPKRAQRFTFD